MSTGLKECLEGILCVLLVSSVVSIIVLVSCNCERLDENKCRALSTNRTVLLQQEVMLGASGIGACKH